MYKNQILDSMVTMDEQERRNDRKYQRHNLSLQSLMQMGYPVEESQEDVAYQESFSEGIKSESLSTCMATLNASEKEIITLRYQEELSFREIGEMLKEKENTVARRHRRSLAKLKKCLESLSLTMLLADQILDALLNAVLL